MSYKKLKNILDEVINKILENNLVRKIERDNFVEYEILFVNYNKVARIILDKNNLILFDEYGIIKEYNTSKQNIDQIKEELLGYFWLINL